VIQLNASVGLLAGLLIGCSSSSSSNSQPIGAEGGACTSGGVCDPGLICLSHLCVRLDDAAVVADATAPADAAVQADTAVDPIACKSWALGGIGIPAGTVPSVSATYTTTLPIQAIDGDLTTGWNSGSNSGWLRLEFPSPVYFTGVRIAAFASPTTSETYTLNADLVTTPIGSATRQVFSGTAGSIVDPIAVTPGTYSSLTLTISGGSSWVMVGEVSLLTPTCP
jgi:hypothetical protein